MLVYVLSSIVHTRAVNSWIFSEAHLRGRFTTSLRFYEFVKMKRLGANSNPSFFPCHRCVRKRFLSTVSPQTVNTVIDKSLRSQGSRSLNWSLALSIFFFFFSFLVRRKSKNVALATENLCNYRISVDFEFVNYDRSFKALLFNWKFISRTFGR